MIDNKVFIFYYDGGIIKYVDDVKVFMILDLVMMINGGKYGLYNFIMGNIDWIVFVNVMVKNYDNLIFDDVILIGLIYVEGLL